MKGLYFAFFLACFSGKAMAQDLLYLADGKTVPGKVTDINAEKIKLSGEDAEGNTYGLDQVLLVVNASGDYFIPSAKINEQEKSRFLTNNRAQLPSNIIINKSGDVIAAETLAEDGTDLVYNLNGEEFSVKIGETAAVIRRNGTHKLYVSAGQAVVPLKAAKPKISTLVSILDERPAAKAAAPAAKTAAPVAKAETEAPKLNLPAPSPGSPELKVNMEAFSKKALQKTEEFSSYLQLISGVNNSREKAMKSIDMAVELFLNEESRVEVSSTNSQVKNKYKVRDYLTRLQFKSGQYDKIIIEYADINYASEFKKGADGNYHGVVTFVQKFRGFVDGEVVYGDITKRNLTIVLKKYEKAVDGGVQESWDVFLADVGVVETKKL